MTEMVCARDLTVAYGEADPVITAANFSIEAGEKVLLLGPSGAGKSTLLSTLAGIVGNVKAAEVRGTLNVAGCDPQRMSLAKYAHHTAILFQDPADQLCLPTVIDEVNFALENRGVEPSEIEPRSRHSLAAFGAGALADRRTHELSGGQGQRVALAATTVAETKLLLLDEPTALLDSAAAAEVSRMIANMDATVIVATHRLDELDPLPGRAIAIGYDGEICADGPTGEVLRDPEVARLGVWLPAAIEVGNMLGRLVGEGDLPAALEELASRNPESPWPRKSSTASRSDGHLIVASRDRDSPSAPDRNRGRPPAIDRHSAAALASAANGAIYRGASSAVSGLNFQLHPGQITAVIGINGSGKSTLLRGLASLLPSNGLTLHSSVGMVFQNPEHQFLARSVAEEIRYGLTVAGAEADLVISQVLDRFALRGRGKDNPYRLSGGEQRRLSLAAMAVMDHELCLLDEPTFGQSRRTAIALAEHMRAMADAGRGIVFATHDLRLVARYADQVVVLRDGEQLVCGPPADVLTDAVLAPAGLVSPRILRYWRGDFASLRVILGLLDSAVAEESADA